MCKKLANVLVSVIFAFFVGGFMSVSIIPQTALAASSCNSGFLGFPAWYQGLTVSDTNCEIISPSSNDNEKLNKFIWRIVLNLITIAMMLAAYVAVFFIIYGGFRFMISRGTPDGMAKARKSILDALIGLTISLLAVGIINFIIGGLKLTT